ncbi:MAG: DUF397 domain-containing protein [Planctomycetes bacterium]|nr:DUF397 domain-containing protein [Planctomycetota bacterium]
MIESTESFNNDSTSRRNRPASSAVPTTWRKSSRSRASADCVIVRRRFRQTSEFSRIVRSSSARSDGPVRRHAIQRIGKLVSSSGSSGGGVNAAWRA